MGCMMMKEIIPGTTKPIPRFPKDFAIDPNTLAAKRYGTLDMVNIWGAEQTFSLALEIQAESTLTLHTLYPEIVSNQVAGEIADKANLKNINPDRIRELEEKTGHDVIAINTALEEQLSPEAASFVNFAKTSADTTQSVRAKQEKRSLEVLTASLENLRDITIEKSIEFIKIPFMDQTHGYDAVPSLAGRAFSHYAEMLQSDLNFLKYVYNNSIIGKWSDATGNHHSAVSFGIDGIKVQKEFCNRIGVKHMDAAAQLPGLEFEADIFYVLARIAKTVDNLASYIADGRGDDRAVFINGRPKKQKGSSAMPHKDAKNGNPDTEEQVQSLSNYADGLMITALENCRMKYARDLSASANARINFEYGFKFFDHTIRRLSDILYWLKIDENNSINRIQRTYGVVTSQQVMNYLLDAKQSAKPMTRSQAHDLIGKLATQAWESKTPFIDVLLQNEEITSRLPRSTLRKITNPLTYIGESEKIIRTVAEKYYQKKTFN